MIGRDLTDEHLQYLAGQGIEADHAERVGIRSAIEPADLPDAISWATAKLPGILFPWRPLDGTTHWQMRSTRDDIDKDDRYVGEPDVSVLNILGDPDTASVVALIEGTKQSIAAAAVAPDGVCVVGIGGCSQWTSSGVPDPDLSICDGKDVVIAFDGDMATNIDVWSGGKTLGTAVKNEGATSVRYVPATGRGDADLADVLGARTPERRARFVANMLTHAEKKMPAKPKRTVKQDPRDDDDDTRAQIDVDRDRRDVIRDVSTAVVDKFDGSVLFNFGGAISVFDPTADEMLTPIGLDDWPNWVSSAAFTYTASETANGDELQDPAWPDSNVMRATLSRSSAFTKLARISPSPFVRDDWTICHRSGYDEASATILLEGVDLADDVPRKPTRAQVGAAVDLLLADWWHDMPFAQQADRAAAAALLITPAIRGVVPLVPLAVIDGVDMGSGKNMLLDLIHILWYGHEADPMVWTGDDAELRKTITSVFTSGSPWVIFDEAHELTGRTLSWALTAVTLRDRILGINKIARFPNNAVWVSLGNQVQMAADMPRRVYRIHIDPKIPDPELRDPDDFRHPFIKEWTREHRKELMVAVFTIIRAWIVAGRPRAPKTVGLASFERWQHTVAGILHHAGIDGFLSDHVNWRNKADTARSQWREHLHDLADHFGIGVDFTSRDVVDAVANDDVRVYPGYPLTETDHQARAKAVGHKYRGTLDRWLRVPDDGTCSQDLKGASLRVIEGSIDRHSKVRRWQIERHIGARTDPEPQESTRSAADCGEVRGSAGMSTPTRTGNVWSLRDPDMSTHVSHKGGSEHPRTSPQPRNGHAAAPTTMAEFIATLPPESFIDMSPDWTPPGTATQDRLDVDGDS